MSETAWALTIDGIRFIHLTAMHERDPSILRDSIIAVAEKLRARQS